MRRADDETLRLTAYGICQWLGRKWGKTFDQVAIDALLLEIDSYLPVKDEEGRALIEKNGKDEFLYNALSS